MSRRRPRSYYDYAYNAPVRETAWDKSGWLLKPLLGLLAVLAVIAVIWGISWLIAWIFPDSPAVFWRDTVGAIRGVLFPGGLPTPFFWIILSIITAVMVLMAAYNSYSRGFVVVAWIVASATVLGTGVLGGVKAFTYEILASDYYLNTTTLEVENPDELPTMLTKYADNGTLEVPVKSGELPSAWVPRVASATGALNVMTKTGDAINNTSLMANTITYVYGEGASGTWTGIRNGVNQQNIYGIASWNGTGDRVDVCRFKGDYAIHKTFGGLWVGKNLWNSVAGTFPSFYFNESDMWGYCDGEEPVIVIPGVELGYYDMQAIDMASGVVTIRGSKSGEPKLEMHTDIKPGDFPGPVYAQRLVDNQRGALDWSAGYWQNVNERFGFDSTDVESQSGNNTNYLMKNEADGRLYWVTPMKPQSTDSQTLIAYSVIPADEVSHKKLNPQTVYVLNEDDARVVNLDDLLARVKSSACEVDTNFCGDNANGGIVEFLPVSDTQWQVFAEVKGRVKYRIDVSVDARIEPSIVDVDLGAPALPDEGSGNEGVVTPGDGPADCNQPSSLTDVQLAECFAALAEELRGRSDK